MDVDRVGRVLQMALIVFGVVLQQPPTSDAPISHHLFTYETKSISGTSVFFWDGITGYI